MWSLCKHVPRLTLRDVQHSIEVCGRAAPNSLLAPTRDSKAGLSVR